MNRAARQSTFVVSAVIALAIAYGSALYARADASATTLTGVVTDMACGKSHSLMKGSGTNAECVRTCVKGGSAFGLVVGDKVIELRGHSAELNKYAAQKVTVHGAMQGKDLLVESVKPAK
jgi:hypothetical protein